MKQKHLPRVARAALAGCVLQVAAPALALEPARLAVAEPRPLASAVERKVSAAASPTAPLLSQDAGAAPSTESRSFFKSPKGVAVLLLMAVGTGYAVYSATNERIDNPAR